MLLCLDYSSHYPNIYVEVTQEDLDRINKVEGNGYLMDTEEGRELLKELRARPHVKVHNVVAYI